MLRNKIQAKTGLTRKAIEYYEEKRFDSAVEIRKWLSRLS